MKPGTKVLVGFYLAGLVLQHMPVWAQKTSQELYKETLAACVVSARNKPTLEMIKGKVNQACNLLGREGKTAFPKFKGKDSEFIFCGSYIWVQDLKGVVRMEPAFPMMEGMQLIDAKDGHDKRPIFEINKLAKEKGAGWVDYWWPKPGEPAPARKISYIKLCKVDGEDMVVGAGVYNLTDNQIDKILLAQKTSKELAKETEAAAVKTAIVRTSSQMVMDKVEKACALLKREGKAAFPQFKGAHSEFIFAGTYIWVHDLKGVMRMHPIKPELEGKNQIDWKDSQGKAIFVEFNKVAKEKGTGWVDYWWPKPGEKNPSRKVSYVKLCNIDGEDMVVGSGIYDLPDAEIDKLIR